MFHNHNSNLDPNTVLRWLVLSNLLVNLYLAVLITVGVIAYFL